MEDTKLGAHPPPTSSSRMEPNAEADVEDKEVFLQQTIQIVEDGNQETIYGHENETKIALFHRFLCETTLPKRTAKARKRLLQHVAYTALMEDKMLNME